VREAIGWEGGIAGHYRHGGWGRIAEAVWKERSSLEGERRGLGFGKLYASSVRKKALQSFRLKRSGL